MVGAETFETIIAGVHSDGTFEAPVPNGRWMHFTAEGKAIEA